MAQDWCGRTWRGDPKYSGGGQINDSGSHYQDILLWMTGLLPVSAEGYIDSIYRGKKLKVEYNGSFNVELTGGVSGRVVILSDIPGGFVDDVRICGTKGSIFFRGDQVILFDQEANEYTEVSLSRPAGYPLSPVDNFVKLLRKKVRINRVPFIFGSRVALLTEAMPARAPEGQENPLRRHPERVEPHRPTWKTKPSQPRRTSLPTGVCGHSGRGGRCDGRLRR